MTGIEIDAKRRRSCAEAVRAAGCHARLLARDFTRGPLPQGPFDLVLLLGNVVMTMTDPVKLSDLLQRAARRLSPRGAILIDDICTLAWKEIGAGNWRTGLAPSEGLQMIMAESEAIFAIRSGGEVRPRSWRITRRDRVFRAWDDAMLGMVARDAGLSGPGRIDGACLLKFSPSSKPRRG